jgi:integrase
MGMGAGKREGRARARAWDAEGFARALLASERSEATAEKYARYAREFAAYAGAGPTREAALGYKKEVAGRHSAAGANGMIAAVNSYLAYLGRGDLRVSPLKVQRRAFADERRQLRKEDFARLLAAAERRGRERTALVLRTLHATGIRVSELRFVTAEAAARGTAEITMKGKTREIFIPDKLRKRIAAYAGKRGIARGPVFVTRTGRPVDRFSVWREMKSLCAEAGVPPERAYPHGVRKLFARIFHAAIPDLAALADVLGHSDVNTTRIYTAETASSLRRRMAAMPLLL